MNKTLGTTLLSVLLLMAQPLAAQTRSTSEASDAGGVDRPQWEPLGQLPVDQAGAGRRGYAIAAEGADVTAPGSGTVSFHMVAANNFYREQNGGFQISQRYETHTIGIGFRRGFRMGILPRVEIGGQIQLTERDAGFMNGFITSFEGMWASLVGLNADLQPRSTPGPIPALGMVVTKNGGPVYRTSGDASGLGDVSVVAKALLHGDDTRSDTRIAIRAALNVAGKTDFTAGNFAGVGVSLDRQLSRRTALHGDVRATFFLDRVGLWGLPLTHASVGFSVGPEFKLATNTSVNLQYDGNTTPYLPTGTKAMDKGYGDVSFGVGHRFRIGGHELIAHIYGRENLNLPIRIAWNADPDLAVGIKATIRTRSR